MGGRGGQVSGEGGVGGGGYWTNHRESINPRLLLTLILVPQLWLWLWLHTRVGRVRGRFCSFRHCCHPDTFGAANIRGGSQVPTHRSLKSRQVMCEVRESRQVMCEVRESRNVMCEVRESRKVMCEVRESRKVMCEGEGWRGSSGSENRPGCITGE